ncbi:phage tail protein [Bradyrhizobium japonicum]|uniref:phage tail protein n=1 Tax=Bradyrhizobium japonicum TaxID=375 RepID=UPI0009B84B55|nr:tail fiber protein [Bradyrhizobium japonicum]
MLPVAGEVVIWAGQLNDSIEKKLEQAGWLVCDGRSLSRAKFPELFAAIGSNYGHGQVSVPENFFIPDFRARSPIGANAAAANGLSARKLGEAVGEEAHTLTIDEIPSHAHRTPAYTGVDGDHTRRDNGLFGATTGSTESVGGGKAHNNMPPSLTVNFLIRFRAG